jgi:hypothetical protein
VWFDTLNPSTVERGGITYTISTVHRPAGLVPRRMEDVVAQLQEGGLPEMMNTAGRPVRVADDRPVQLWCLERASAREFNRALRPTVTCARSRASKTDAREER